MEDMFSELDRLTTTRKGDDIVKAPFPYPGGKSRSVKHILPLLPYTKRYVEPFGGSGAVLLARHSSKMEVLNDRYSGVTDFYKCIRSASLFKRLLERLELTVHSKEDFVYCKDWDTFDDPVERAAAWYSMVSYSFGSLGRNWGRATAPNGRLSGKLRNALDKFPAVHERLKYVQVENQDWYDCMKDYDHPDTVFYLDPPYFDSYKGTYKHELTLSDHQEMLDFIFRCNGFVAFSGYENPMIDALPWSSRHDWESFVSIKAAAFTEGNNKVGTEAHAARGNATEVLWIKEATR